MLGYSIWLSVTSHSIVKYNCISNNIKQGLIQLKERKIKEIFFSLTVLL